MTDPKSVQKRIEEAFRIDWELVYTTTLPSMFIKYWFDDEGILHRRVISEEEAKINSTEDKK